MAKGLHKFIDDQIFELEIAVKGSIVTALEVESLGCEVDEVLLTVTFPFVDIQPSFLVHASLVELDVSPLEPGSRLIDTPYSVLTVECIKSIQTWQIEDKDGLVRLVLELREALRWHHRRLIEKHSSSIVRFSYDAIKQSEFVEARLTDSGAIMVVVPLFQGSADILSQIMLLITIPAHEFLSDAVVTLILPPQFLLTSSYCPPCWDLRTSLFDFLPTVQLAIQTNWLKRREFYLALAALFPVVDHDAFDYAKVILLAKKAKKHIRLVEFTVGVDFPEIPPSIKISEFHGPESSSKLDPSLFRYSPRWPPQRMAEELFQHALANFAG
jgi:hypothetical protein